MRFPATVRVGRVSAEFGGSLGLDLLDTDSKLATFDPNMAERGPHRPIPTNIGRVWAQLGPSVADSVQRWPILVEPARIWSVSGRFRKLARIGPKLCKPRMWDKEGDGRVLPVPWVRAAVDQIASALAYMHAKVVAGLPPTHTHTRTAGLHETCATWGPLLG